MFPYLRPSISSADGAEVDQKKLREIVEEDLQSNLAKHCRSRSAGKFFNAPEGPWHVFPSIQRAEQPQPAWSPNSGPFTKPNSGDEETWWLDDHAARHAMIEDWQDRQSNRQSCKRRDCQDQFCVHFQEDGQNDHANDSPQNNTRDADYATVPSLSKAYVADRNYEWWHENVQRLEAEENDKAREETERQYRNEVRTAKELVHHVQKLEYQVRQSPANLQYQAALQTMTANLRRMNGHLQHTRERLFQLRKECGYAGVSLVAGLEVDLEPKRTYKKPTPTKPTSPGGPKRMETIAPGNAVAEPGCTPHPNQEVVVVVQSSGNPDQPNDGPQHPTAAAEQRERGSKQTRLSMATTIKVMESFPEYQDPMTEDTKGEPTAEEPDVAVEEAQLQRRTSAAKALAKILEDTGALHRRHTSWQLPQAGTPSSSPPPTPIAPAEWLGINRVSKDQTARDDNGKPLRIRFVEPAIVGEVSTEAG